MRLLLDTHVLLWTAARPELFVLPPQLCELSTTNPSLDRVLASAG